MKKLTALILTVLCALSFTATAKTFEDTKDIPCTVAVTLLSDLGIVTGKSDTAYEPDALLTRAEMATIVVRLFNMEDVGQGTERFADVTQAHWAYKNIGAAYGLGIINGVDDAHFAPDAPLTYAQAVKMLVCALGYGAQADAMGGYPGGYLAKGSQLGILQTTRQDEAITRGTMAQLVANSLECDLLVRQSYGNSYAFVEKEGATLLSEYLDIDVYKGRITANAAISLDGSLMRPAHVALGGVLYKVGETDAENYIAQKVTLYVSDETILSVLPEKNTRAFTFNAADVTEPKIGTIECENTTLSFGNAVIVFNGAQSAFSLPESGTITCICDDGTDCDVVLIQAYKNYVVKRADASDKTVYFKEGAPLSFDNDDITLANADGTEATVEDCKEWDVLSVFQGTDKTQVIRSAEKTSGKIAEYDGKRAKIGDSDYKIATDLLLSLTLTKPSLGLSGAFYLDFGGNIAAIDNSEAAQTALSDAAQYGYLISTVMTKGLDAHPQLQIYTKDGKLELFEVKERLTLTNGMDSPLTVTPQDFAVNSFGMSAGGITITPQAVRYRANEEHELTELEFATDIVPDLPPAERNNAYFTLEEMIASSLYLGGHLRTFLSRYYVGDDCVIINLPDVLTSNEKDYSVSKAADLVHAKVYKNIEIYDIQRDGAISLLVMKGAVAATVGDSATVGLITAVSSGLNADDEVTQILKIADKTGNETTYYVESDLEVLFGTNGTAKNVIVNILNEREKDGAVLKNTIAPIALRPGDIVSFEALNDKIKSMAVRFRAEAPIRREMGMTQGNSVASTMDKSYTSQLFWYGEVEYISDRLITTHVPATSGTETEWMRLEPLYTAKVMRFDMKKQTFSTSTADAICEGDMVFVFRETLYPRMIIVYDNI